MALSNADIIKFARAAVEYDANPSYNATPERKAKLLAEAKRAALSYYDQAQTDIRDSGYRVTRRVKYVLWEELKRIAAEAEEK